MTPRERAKKIIDSVAVRLSLADQDVLRDKIEQAIIADRQALQSEIMIRLDSLLSESEKEWSADRPMDAFYRTGLRNAMEQVQSVFAQQSPPEESKQWAQHDETGRIGQFDSLPDRYTWCGEMIPISESDRRISETLSSIARSFCGAFRISNNDPPGVEAIKRRIEWLESHVGELEQECGQILRESDRRVLAEREACAKICDSVATFDEEKSVFGDLIMKETAQNIGRLIRARSDQPEENAKIKTVPIVAHENLEAYSYYVEKVNDWQSSRIATLHEWQAKDAQTIQQLNVSNNALSLKVAQLEKEKHGLTEKLKISTYCFIGRSAGLPCGDPGCDNCPAS